MKLFVGYIFTAGFATIVDIALLYILTDRVGLYYLYSAAISYFAGMLVNYITSKYFVFKNKSPLVGRQFGLFAIVALIGLGLNQCILWFLVDTIGVWYIAAKIVSVCLVMFWSFYGHKKLTFNYFT